MVLFPLQFELIVKRIFQLELVSLPSIVEVFKLTSGVYSPQSNAKIASMAPKGKKSNRSSKKNGKQVTVNVLTPHLQVRLPYIQRALLNEAAAGVGAFTTWSLNNIFDPFVPAGGAQPLGFDQYTQFYGRYRVVGFSYKISFGNITGTTNPIWAGVFYSPQSTVPSDPVAWAIQPTGAKWVQLAAVSAGGACRTISGTVDIPAVMGVTKSEYMDEMDFAATTSGGPARQGYLHVWIFGYTASSACNVLVDLKYLTEFSQPVALSMS